MRGHAPVNDSGVQLVLYRLDFYFRLYCRDKFYCDFKLIPRNVCFYSSSSVSQSFGRSLKSRHSK